MTARRSLLGLATALVGLVVIGALIPPSVSAAGVDASADGPRRMLVLAVPGLTWEEVDRFELPAIEGFLAHAALADLAPRGVSARSGPGDAYLTISAGTRSATERQVDGQVLALDEQSSGSAAGEIFTRRTGIEPSGPFVSLSWPSLVRRNDAQPFDAELGLLADTLVAEGMTTFALGNADGTDAVAVSYERQVGLAVATSEGVVPAGALGKELLVDDPARPFGKRLDLDAVTDAFDGAWARADRDGGLVVVEASDLARTMRYRSVVSAGRYATIRAQALRESDDLFAHLLEAADPARDTVMLVSPYNSPGDRNLTAVALRAPGSSAGYLMSASTQRSGFLTLVDIAPTILDRLGLRRPTGMEGRPAEVVASSASVDARLDRLISLNQASRFRERLLTPTTVVVVLGMALVAAGAAVVVAGGRAAAWRRWLALAALVDLSILPASYVARGFPLEDLGVGFYWLVVAGVALAAGVGATWVGRRVGNANLPLLLVLGFVAAVLVADVTTGSRLSLNAAFGYSPTGNSRLYGISNYSFGQLATAVCLLAAFAAASSPPARGRRVAIGLLVATLVVLGLPTWGADVGGVLAFTPTILLFAAFTTRRRVRPRTVVLGLAVTAAAVTAFGLVDLARPASQRAHLGRLFERVGDEGIGPLLSIVQRKLLANLEVSTSSFWVATIPVGVAVWVLLARHPSRPLERLRRRVPMLGAGVAAALVAGLLGSVLNDSGAIVGGVAVLVLTASVLHLLMVHEGSTAAG